MRGSVRARAATGHGLKVPVTNRWRERIGLVNAWPMLGAIALAAIALAAIAILVVTRRDAAGLT